MTVDIDDDTIAALVQAVGVETAKELTGFFIEETHTRLGRMAGLVATLGQGDNWAALERDAHSLKSASASFGLPGLSGQAKTLEGTATSASDIQEAATLFSTLFDDAKTQLFALEAKINSIKAKD